MEKLKNKINNEKGSITLYVLVTMMLFLMVIVFMYMQTRSKNSTQLQQLSEIQKEYESSNIDDTYQKEESIYRGEVIVTFYTPDGERYDINEWTNQDVIVKITYPHDIKDENKYYYKDGEKIPYTDNEVIKENCTISTEYNGKKQEIHITKIDKTPATVEFNENGKEYILGEGETQTEISTTVTADDGAGSGVQKIEYQITSSVTEPSENSGDWKKINNGETIKENKLGGTYYVYVKVTDNVGNVEIYRSNKFEVKYQVIFDVNGGTGTITRQVKTHGNSLTLTTQKPSKEGYEFIGWGTSKDDETVDYEAGGTYIENKTIRLYAIYKKTITGTFNYYDNGPKSITVSEDAFNDQTTVEITAPEIAKVERDGITLTGRGWSTDDSQTANIELKANEKVTISANSTYFASYSGTVTGTFNYYDGSKQAKETSSATRYMNYEGTYTQNNIPIPEKVTESKGPANTTYSHVSTTKTGEGETPNTELGVINYYTVYKKTVTATLYTYNNQKTTKTGTAYGYYDGTTANASIGLGTTSLSGYTARGWSTEKEGNANINVALNGTASILNDTTYYMSYSYTVTATYYYYNGSSYTSSKPTATAYMNYAGTRIGAKPTTPSVSNPSGWSGRGWSTSSSATGTVATPGTITANEEYYYSWQKTVTATLYTYNNQKTSKTGTAYLDYKGTTTNASIGLGTTTAPSGYTARGWSTSSTANAGITVALNGTASINTNTTYYMSYSYTIKATFYYYDGSKYTSSGPTATAYMNYAGTKIGGTPQAPTVKNPSGWTGRGWSTSSSPTGTVVTPGVITENSVYYYSWQKTVTATLYTYNNQKTSKTGTAYLDYKGTTTNASIGLGTTTAPSGYTARGWSTSSTANAGITVALNGTASINTNTTYYMSYTYTVTATYYYYNGSSYTSSKPTATAYMNYVGTKIGGKPTTPSVSSPSGWTARGWSTSSSPTGTVAAPGAITANEEYYYSWQKTVTATLYTYNNQKTTKTGIAYLNYKGTITNASINLGTTSLSGYTFRGWSTSNTANAGITVGASKAASINANTTYYASYSYTVTATYYYYNGSSYTSSKPTATAYMNYVGTKIGGKPTIPTVKNPSGWSGRGWSTSSSATGTVATPGTITANEEYYYSWSKTVTATLYTYNNQKTSKTGTAYLDYKGTTTNASINLGTTSLSGYTFRGWSTSNTANAGITVGASKAASINANTTYYASYSYTVTATYYYYNGSSYTSSKPTATAYMNYVGTKIGGKPTIPTVKNPSGWSGRGWSTSSSATGTVATPGTITANEEYYYSWSKTVTATLYTYNNQKTSKTGTAYLNYKGTITNASINLGTTSLSGYTFRGWSTSNTANAGITVGASKAASINTNTTYYASYSYTITATYYYYNGSSYTSSKPTATGYMNYVGTKIGAKPTTPTVKNPSGWTARGWSTSSSATGTVATPGTITSNKTYYYSWKKTITLTYNSNGGSGAPGSQSTTRYLNYAGIESGGSITVASTKPTKTYYTFSSWNTDLSGTGTKYSAGATITSSTTLYAQWKAIPIMQASNKFQTNVMSIKSTIKEIEFLSSIPNLSSYSQVFDVSEAQNKSVMAYVSGTKLYIAGNGKVIANETSELLFNEFDNVTNIKFNNNFDTSNVVKMSRMFKGCSSLTTLDVSEWDTSSVENMKSIFQECSSLRTLDVSKWNTSKVYDMSQMFMECSSLTTLDVREWDTSSVENMDSIFQGCSSLTTLNVSDFDTSNVVKMPRMFKGCSSLTTLDVSEWDTSSVENMKSIFQECSSLRTLDVSKWNTSKVYDMSQMFMECSSLTTLDVSEWDTSSVKSMNSIFQGCSSLRTLDVSKWNTSKVYDMTQMFWECSSLTTLDVSKWDTSNVTIFFNMFFKCSSLTTLDVSKWNTSKVYDMTQMFMGCSSLTTLDLSKWNTSKIDSTGYMFYGCNSLSGNITIMNPNITQYLNYQYMFSECSTKSGSKFTVNYSSECETLAKNMVSTKSYNSNVVLGTQK